MRSEAWLYLTSPYGYAWTGLGWNTAGNASLGNSPVANSPRWCGKGRCLQKRVSSPLRASWKRLPSYKLFLLWVPAGKTGRKRWSWRANQSNLVSQTFNYSQRPNYRPSPQCRIQPRVSALPWIMYATYNIKYSSQKYTNSQFNIRVKIKLCKRSCQLVKFYLLLTCF